MMARIVYGLEHLNFGDDDEQTGWYIMRFTVVTRDGHARSAIDRKPIARIEEPHAMDIVQELDEAIGQKQFVMLKRGWTLADVPR